MPALSLWGHKPGLSSLIGVSGSMVSGTFEGTFEARNSGFLRGSKVSGTFEARNSGFLNEIGATRPAPDSSRRSRQGWEGAVRAG